MSTRQRLTYRFTVIFLTAAAATLFSLNAYVLKTGQPHTFSQAIGEALIVALVVSIAVEPRLLQHFGNEIASRTFWTSFYSRAPEEYRTGIQGLAEEKQFTRAMKWCLSFDWVDDKNRDIIKLTITYISFRENRDTEPFKVTPGAFVFESRFPNYKAEFISYTMRSESLSSSADVLQDANIQAQATDDGRLVIFDKDKLIFTVKPEQRFSVETRLATYVDTMGYYPLTVTRPTLTATVQLLGTALDDLYISILHPGSGTIRTQKEGIGTKLQKEGEIKVGEVYITGQAVLISWKAVSEQRS